MVDRIAIDWETSGLDEATMSLVRFAVKLTQSPHQVGESDVHELREQGFDDRGISSCVQVVAYFNYINRIAEGLGVAPEEWIDDAGRVIDAEEGQVPKD